MREVTRNKGFRMTRNAEVGIDDDAPSTIHLDAEIFRKRLGLYSGCLNDVRAADRFPFELDLAFTDRFDRAVHFNGHPHAFEG